MNKGKTNTDSGAIISNGIEIVQTRRCHLSCCNMTIFVPRYEHYKYCPHCGKKIIYKENNLSPGQRMEKKLADKLGAKVIPLSGNRPINLSEGLPGDTFSRIYTSNKYKGGV